MPRAAWTRRCRSAPEPCSRISSTCSSSALAAELAGDLPGELERPRGQRSGRHELRVPVEQLGVEAVTGRLEGRLGERLPGRDVVLLALRLDPRQAVDECRQGPDALYV